MLKKSKALKKKLNCILYEKRRDNNFIFKSFYFIYEHFSCFDTLQVWWYIIQKKSIATIGLICQVARQTFSKNMENFVWVIEPFTKIGVIYSNSVIKYKSKSTSVHFHCLSTSIEFVANKFYSINSIIPNFSSNIRQFEQYNFFDKLHK